jgi:hypothetical protein
MDLNALVAIAVFLFLQTGMLVWTLATLTQAVKDHGYRIEQLEKQSWKRPRTVVAED